MPAIDIEKILWYAIQKWSSDIHITEGDYIAFRTSWHLEKLMDAPKLEWALMDSFAMQIFNQNKEKLEEFKIKHDEDFAYVSKTDGTPFRVNWFFKMWKMGFIMRRIEREAKKMESLGLPPWVQKLVHAKQWLFLVTWPTWSWKSTTMVSILDKINELRAEHIITVEDPIEFIFSDKKSIFSQREVWHDTDSFIAAIRWAMREDPDIVMVWEMRDVATVEAALNLAETWHLVFSTLHTSGSVSTINRVVQFFKPDVQHQARIRLSDALLWVLSQRLVPRTDKDWRVAIHELMFLTPWIKNLIRSWDFAQINNNIETWSSEWMIPMKRSAEEKINAGMITPESVIWYWEED